MSRFLLLLLMFVAPARAADTYVSPSGNDAGDCIATPCKTLQRAANMTGYGDRIFPAPGVYRGTANIAHNQFVRIIGDCSDWSRVVIEVPSGAAGFTVQDHATGTIRCVTLIGGVGSVGLISRQFAIVDFDNMRFGNFERGTHVAAVEQSKMNCGGTIEIFGGAVVFGQAGGNSTLLMPCIVNITGSPAIDYFYVATGRSLIEAYTTTYIGNSVGRAFALQDSSLNRNTATVPGTEPGLLYEGARAY